jgi:hypothetical protein
MPEKKSAQAPTQWWMKSHSFLEQRSALSQKIRSHVRVAQSYPRILIGMRLSFARKAKYRAGNLDFGAIATVGNPHQIIAV